MIGEIGCVDSPGRFVSIRGKRLKTMLGALVGSRMVARPLSRDAFLRIATGSDEADSLARKNANMAVVRLREIVGSDAIVTGAEYHEIDTNRVDVDILTADSLARRAMKHMADGSLLRAVPTLREALAHAGTDVPFPGLYDEFFETLRSDFEALLRRTTLDISRLLLAEGDNRQAEQLLDVAWQAMPDDEELAELLADALRGQGRSNQAHSVLNRG